MEHFKIRDLSFSYPGSKEKKILDDISLTIEKGEFAVICGKSGSGKTTLLRHFKSVLSPHGKRSGEIFFNGALLENIGAREQSSKIGYVMQNPDEQIVTDKVWHELAFGLESLGHSQKSMRSGVAEMACYFGMQDWFYKDTAKLSGGQKQLLNLAGVMVMRPEVLILDEPTAQLDPIAASDFLNTVRKINTELGVTVIITEHRLEELIAYCDRTVVMDNGRIIANDSPKKIGKQLYEQKNPIFSAMPAPMRVFCAVNGQGECPLTVREGRSWLSRELGESPKINKLPTQPFEQEVKNPALSLKELWFRYEKDGPDVLKGVSLEVPQGSLSAVVGGNGVGKSTALKAVCGICKPYRGKIKLFGKPVDKLKPNELFNKGVSMLPQDPKNLFVKKSVREELSEMTKDSKKIEETAELCNITGLLEAHPYDLSGGEQQRAAFAKVLLSQPRILLLDEPTKGMDSVYKKSFASFLIKLKERGVTVLMVSHDIEFCAEYADRVSMFFDGKILTTDAPQSFFGQNSFYTTAANRMSRHVFTNAVTAENVVELYRMNKAEKI